MAKHSSDSESITSSGDRIMMVSLLEEATHLKETDTLAAEKAAEKGLLLSLQLQDRNYQFEFSYLLGRILTLQGRLDEAHAILNEALKLAKTHFPKDRPKLSLATNSIGIVYYSQDNRELALDCFLKALQFDVLDQKLKILNNLGNTYTVNGNHEKALEYFDAAREEADRVGDVYMLTALLLNSTTSLAHFGDMERALSYSKEALGIANTKINWDERFIHLKIHALMTLGDLYLEINEYENALEVINESLEISEKSSSYVSYCMALNLMAVTYLKMDREEKALEYVSRTLENCEKYQHERAKKDVLDNVIEYYEDKGEIEKAYPYLKLRYEQSEIEIKKSRDENFKKIIGEREMEIQLLEEKNDEIISQNLLLEQFAHIISHDLKEPIRNIVSFSHLLERRLIGQLNDEVSEFLKFIVDGARNMNQNLTRLLDFTTLKKLENQEVQKISIPELINSLNEDYINIIHPFIVQIDYPNEDIHMVLEHAVALFDEIIRNSIKFRKKGENCNIKITASQEAGHTKISIRDFGIGIKSEYQKQIFKIFNRLNKKDYEGAGVGLAICERIVHLYKGQIWMESKEGKGTIVHFTISHE